MTGNKHYSTLYLVMRSLLPSAMSGVLCVCFSIGVVAVHLLLLSLNLGTSLPKFFDGQWATLYTNNVVQPLETLFNNLAFNQVLLIILWGLAGLATYFLIEYCLHIYRHWSQAERDIQIVGQQVIYHPMRRTFLLTVMWRCIILVTSAVLFIMAQALLQRLLSADPQLVAGSLPLAASIRRLIMALVGWAVLAHSFVVFLRLFLMRTRLFGDPAIE